MQRTIVGVTIQRNIGTGRRKRRQILALQQLGRSGTLRQLIAASQVEGPEHLFAGLRPPVSPCAQHRWLVFGLGLQRRKLAMHVAPHAVIRSTKLMDGLGLRQRVFVCDEPALTLGGRLNTRGGRSNNQKGNQKKQKATHN